MKIALVCDWLTTPGGAEKVLLELHHMYPDAPIYTSQYSKKGINWFNDATVKTGWLQIFPRFLRKFLGPLRQLYFSHLDLSAYDLVISVTGAEAKTIKFNPAKTHLCYCHVPTQYYWQFYDRYLENPGFGLLDPLVRFFFKLLVKPLRKADYRAAQKPTKFITISHYAAAEIKKYYHRSATVIAPPVDLTTFSTAKSTGFSTKDPQFSTKLPNIFTETPQISTASQDFSTKNPQKTAQKSTETGDFSTTFPQFFHNQQYFIISCRQVTWKRVDLAISACLATESPLLVVGDGPEHKHLLKIANNSPLIKFLPWSKPDELAQYLQGAKAYLFPSLEPFGIAAVEALATGCPVIALADGGSTDFIEPGKNGLTFAEQTTDSLASALRQFEKTSFNRATVQKSAAKFSTQHFSSAISNLVDQSLKSSKIQSRKGTKK